MRVTSHNKLICITPPRKSATQRSPAALANSHSDLRRPTPVVVMQLVSSFQFFSGLVIKAFQSSPCECRPTLDWRARRASHHGEGRALRQAEGADPADLSCGNWQEACDWRLPTHLPLRSVGWWPARVRPCEGWGPAKSRRVFFIRAQRSGPLGESRQGG